MSDRKICVCGRERGKEPVIITITTCRHKHPSKCSSSICISKTSDTCDSAEIQKNNKKESIRIENNENPEEKKKESIYITEYQTKSIIEPTTNKDSTIIPDQTGNDNTTVDNSVVIGEADQKEEEEKDEDKPTVVSDALAGDTQAEEATEPAKIDESSRSNTASSEYVIAASSELQENTVEKSSENPEANPLDESELNADDSTPAPENIVEQSEPAESETTNENTVEDASEEEAKEEEATEGSTDDKNPTIMFVREIAVNTVSFLDNLFWTRSATNKSKFNSTEDHDDPENCSTEVFIFEKHSKFCRHYTNGPTNQNLFFDGDRLCETLAKVSFPACCDDFTDGVSKSSKLALVYSQLKNSFIAQEEPDFYERTFKTSNSFNKNKNFFENLKKKDPEPFNLKLQKYITMGDDIYQKKFSKTDVEELYCRKSTKEQSSQMGEPHLNTTNNTRPTKWYDIFLICLGLKESEDLYEVESNIESPGESSFVITRYLRI